jgi:hypothetical protein
MKIAFIDPLSRGIKRMAQALFKPFDIGKWLVVGFTAFLAGLTDCNHRGHTSGGNGNGDHDLDDITRLPSLAWEWLTDHPGWFLLIVFSLCFLIVLAVVLTWLSSRGKFMFLDNVVHDRAQVVKPWHEFRALGNSLFIWRLCYGLVCFVVFITFFIFCLFTIYHLDASDPPVLLKILPLAGMGLMFMALLITAGYISLFLTDFVVPLMYKHNLASLGAWDYFLSLLKKHILHFLLYGILVFFLNILVIICVVIIGLFTCCMGFIFLIIPYIGSVLLLPISYSFRAFSLEFLEQFGPDFTLFPQTVNDAEDAPAP